MDEYLDTNLSKFDLWLDSIEFEQAPRITLRSLKMSRSQMLKEPEKYL